MTPYIREQAQWFYDMMIANGATEWRAKEAVREYLTTIMRSKKEELAYD
jgi:hypothetical protein